MLAPGGGKMRDPGNEVDYQDVLLQDDAREQVTSSLVSGEHFLLQFLIDSCLRVNLTT